MNSVISVAKFFYLLFSVAVPKPVCSLRIQPTLDLAPVLVDYGRFLVALLKTERTTRRKATSLGQIDQAGWLTGDEHRV